LGVNSNGPKRGLWATRPKPKNAPKAGLEPTKTGFQGKTTEGKQMSKVEKRLAKLERDKGLHSRFGSPQGSGEPNRHGMPKLPPGQRQVETWPVLDLGHVPTLSRENWKLSVNGLVEQPLELNFQEFLALGSVEDVSDFHCVTGWSRMDNHWKGVRVKDLAAKAGLKPQVTHVQITAYDLAPGTEIPYTTNLPLDQALEEDVLLVYQWEGKSLAAEHGGPVRMITPKLWAWKGAKWVRALSFIDHDQPGFWEVRGYSNTAEPWYDDRYSY